MTLGQEMMKRRCHTAAPLPPLIMLFMSASGVAGQTVIANSQLQTCIASGSVRMRRHIAPIEVRY